MTYKLTDPWSQFEAFCAENNVVPSNARYEIWKSTRNHGDPRNGFCVTIVLHTDDARRVLSSPEDVREIVGQALDSRGVFVAENERIRPLQEEIDYTLRVRRCVSGGRVDEETN